MRKMMKVVGGAMFGLAVVSVAPAHALAAGGFCSETETLVTCCSTDSQNKIVSCNVFKKPT